MPIGYNLCAIYMPFFLGLDSYVSYIVCQQMWGRMQSYYYFLIIKIICRL